MAAFLRHLIAPRRGNQVKPNEHEACNMLRRFFPGVRLVHILKHIVNSKFLIIFFLFCFSYIAWVRYPEDFSTYNKELVEEALQNVGQDFRYADVYRSRTHLSKNLKYVLLWTDSEYAPFNFFAKGQKAFITNNCSMVNCYITDDRNFFSEDLTKFDAIAFNGRNIREMPAVDLPTVRSPHQKYIYFNTESADNYPVCDGTFDGYFNWTATYKLDSDIVYPYMLIKNVFGEVVGPKRDMKWVEMSQEIDNNLAFRLQNKTKVGAWFVSHCSSRSRREDFVAQLRRAFRGYGVVLDVYGSCGVLKCPRNCQSDCNAMLERDYYFYMSLENSFAEDYVTEKLLTALQHDVVPIVFGGANYSRFLPPGSYIDGRAYHIRDLASLMFRLMKSQTLYQQFFKWKNYYTYHDATRTNICAVCEALNNKTKVETYSSYDNLRDWWNNEDPQQQ